MPENKKALGLCLGASTVSIVQIEQEWDTNKKPRVIKYSLHAHEGNPRQTLASAIKDFDLNTFDKVVVTGRKFCNFVKLSSVSEPEAVEYAYKFIKPSNVSCPAVVSAGGETFMVYAMDKFGQISNVITGNKCASGTGEFFLQQLRRMNVSLEEASKWAVDEDPYHVSGRCSVFCKSDCTHATNKGTPKSKVTAGLCKMMASKVMELLKKIKLQNVMIVGGTARNHMMINFLNKDIEGLIIPKEAPYFEALGAALWSLEHEVIPFPKLENLFSSEATSFNTLPPIHDFTDMVEFKTIEMTDVKSGDEYVLGLDVGSTTTKAILLNTKDNSIGASIYLRTDGDPVGASKKCYNFLFNEIKAKVDPSQISVIGLGVCGSGRQIAGLHALTDGVINEIIAHATAAIFFDAKVDTIFEIGGQDAKYTYVTNSVPSDYAMNEACSAGTGSFLEESAYETLGIKMEDIADIALKSNNPPNFNDQCAAFISSDIKNAIHEGIKHEDIVAGLVYSICMNYSNRVKGNRPVGEKVFMQGGVCYNKAVPIAMASLTGKPIIVPPEPGLMGSFGVALEVKKRIELGLMERKDFNLEILMNREVKYGKSFVCGGGKEKCDRRCKIAMIELEGKKYPFGGACNRYYNLRHNVKYDIAKLDLARVRQQLVYEKYGAKPPDSKKYKGRVGLNRSFLVNTYYPLYSTFFAELGFESVMPDVPSQKGMDQQHAPFCYPVELAHGFFYSLIQMENPPEFIFLPHFKAVPITKGLPTSQVCPLVQGETFFLRTTFRKKIGELKNKGTKLITPLLDMTTGLDAAKKSMVDMAVQMGISRKEAGKAFEKAIVQQNNCTDEMKQIGKQVIAELETDPDKIAVVILGRPYNGFVEEANMGIPNKLASRGILTIPLDFLSFDDEKSKRNMYWGMGQLILKAARVIKRHPQLFGTYITNFSCGPDSFVVGYFRNIMERKPSLTLELDSHTADAGLETRIEAFLDIVAAYKQLVADKQIVQTKKNFVPAKTVLEDDVMTVITSSGKTLPMSDPNVTLLFPSMGKIPTEAFGAVFRGKGFNAIVHPPADDAVLKLGRANTSCKECLPLILTTGTLLNYIRNKKRDDEVLVYFMPTAAGPCRFGQYYVFMEGLIKKFEISDVAMFSLTSENAYGGLGNDFQISAWHAVITGDVMEDIRSMILANSVNVEEAIAIFNEEWALILNEIEKGDFALLKKQLAKTAERFSHIPMKIPPEQVPVIALAGEIFVRHDSISRQYLVARLAKEGLASVCASVAEWILYSDYLVEHGLVECQISKMEKLKLMLRKQFMSKHEKSIKSILSRSGLVHAEPINIKSIIEISAPYISHDLTGEAVLTIGSVLAETASHACGAIAIGPFGCMPNRISEAILNEIMNREGKIATDPKNKQLHTILENMEELPFLAIESDGSPFPQLINAKLETFFLRARRLHDKMLAARTVDY